MLALLALETPVILETHGPYKIAGLRSSKIRSLEAILDHLSLSTAGTRKGTYPLNMLPSGMVAAGKEVKDRLSLCVSPS